jgi:glucokinase
MLGIYLSSRTIRFGTVNGEGKVLSFHREALPAPENESASTERLLTLVRQAIKEQSASSPIAAIGVGLPGLVNQTTRQIVALPNAPSLVSANLYDEFSREFNLPLAVENNANTAAYAEMCCGSAQSVSDWMYLSIGHGIGSGLVLDGRLRRGKSGYAGEIGHINIDPDGMQCVCGSFGCLETRASVPNIIRRTKERLHRDATSSLSRFNNNEEMTYDDIIAAAQAGDDLAVLMMQRTGHFIGLAVADVINLLNLSMIVIGGATAARQFLVPAIIEEARRRAFVHTFEDCQIVPAQLGEEAGVIGAALLAGQMTARL